ncbi:hypothetical protein INT47_005317 [Mucor saturninus]|uniref:Uncharacterized protein n=1 Tax=Mucor saturninus TaxID=64648 RepID=A0A8H7R7X1_9FUNG|nr:hypothetical protein INT47_005317 [Mucor saturninus]
MEHIVAEAAQELESRLSIENLTSATMASWNHETSACIKRIEDTAQLTNKIQSETELIQEMLTCLNQKQGELQATFDKIDQLEALVNKVKDTYNAMGENVDMMEKAVSASTPFRLVSLAQNKALLMLNIFFFFFFVWCREIEIYQHNHIFHRHIR